MGTCRKINKGALYYPGYKQKWVCVPGHDGHIISKQYLE